MVELSRETTEALEMSIQTKKAEQKLLGSDTERLNGLLLGLQQGAAGLLQRVSPHMGGFHGAVGRRRVSRLKCI